MVLICLKFIIFIFNMKYLLLLPILPLIFSCSNEKKIAENTSIIKIDINNKHIPNLPKLSLKSIISLEQNNESLFGHISAIEYIDDRIYLLDVSSSKSVMSFSDKGDFTN